MTDQLTTHINPADTDVIEVLVASVTAQIQKLDQIPEGLISVHNELQEVQNTLHQYAPRKEVKRARWRMFFLIIGLVLGLQFIQSTEITNCFLNTSTRDPGICHVIYPGYGKAVDQQRLRAQQLRDEVASQNKFDNQVIQYKDVLDKETAALQKEVQQLQQKIDKLEGH